MLKVMDRVLKRAGADKPLRQRFAAAVREAGSHEDARVPPAGGQQEPAPQPPDAAEAR